MSFLDTEPAAIHRLDAAGPWSRFRITDPRRRDATLRELCRGDVPLTIGVAGGPTLTALLWSMDDAQGRLHLSVPPETPLTGMQVDALLAAPVLWAAGYLNDMKVQFDIVGIQRQAGGQQRMLQAEAPRTMVHLPRRKSVRVRRADVHASIACLQHPRPPHPVLRLRVADVSLSGCALWLPGDAVPLPTGSQIRAVEIELDGQMMFFADLRVQHLTVSRRPAGILAGCAWQGMGSQASDTLRRWIDRGRRRRDLLSLSFD